MKRKKYANKFRKDEKSWINWFTPHILGFPVKTTDFI